MGSSINVLRDICREKIEANTGGEHMGFNPNFKSRSGFGGKPSFNRGSGGAGFGGKPSFGGGKGGFGGDREDFFKKARKRVTIAVSSRDNLLIQTVSAVDELNKSSNLLFERLTEWYGMHFPEFKTSDNAKYVDVVLSIDRGNPDMKELERIFGPSAQPVFDKARRSMGSPLSQEDLSQIRALASQIKMLWALRDSVEAYETKVATELCPNMSYVAGPSLAAKLVAQAGGLKRISTMPSSTIQVLGAEKALFKHLRSGSRPPKHGLIFQHSLISMSPKKARGKISRLLAARLTIAAKADEISHNFIAEKLKESFETNAKRIIAKANAPEKPKFAPPAKPLANTPAKPQ